MAPSPDFRFPNAVGRAQQAGSVRAAQLRHQRTFVLLVHFVPQEPQLQQTARETFSRSALRAPLSPRVQPAHQELTALSKTLEQRAPQAACRVLWASPRLQTLQAAAPLPHAQPARRALPER